MAFQPAYYQGRRTFTFHAISHPVTYVYTFVHVQFTSPTSVAPGNSRLRMVKADAFRREIRRGKGAPKG